MLSGSILLKLSFFFIYVHLFIDLVSLDVQVQRHWVTTDFTLPLQLPPARSWENKMASTDEFRKEYDYGLFQNINEKNKLKNVGGGHLPSQIAISFKYFSGLHSRAILELDPHVT